MAKTQNAAPKVSNENCADIKKCVSWFNKDSVTYAHKVMSISLIQNI